MNGARDVAIGIDVGGTHTDAVALDAAGRVLARTKRPTTDDVTSGLGGAVDEVLRTLGADRWRVSRVMLGTTHATNAVVARRRLDRVAVIRLGAPAATEYPPLIGWPIDLAEQVRAGSAMLGGGHMVDGTPISPLDRDGIRRFLDSLDGRFDSVAVCGIYSPSSPDQEREVEALVDAHLGGLIPIFLSQDIGPDGLLERENATVLNAALRSVAREVTNALREVVAERGLDVATYFAQNDGTLMTLEHAARHPVLTIGSGPSNSLRGAALLSGAADAIVIDVGGTTSDLGVLVRGFPRDSTLPREIGGVRTNFRMPDILSLGIGGGTIIDAETGRVGPGSVGHCLADEALVFGGSTPTLTDAAAAAGVRVAGRSLHVPEGLGDVLTEGLRVARERLERAVERLALGRVDLPVIAVGGGGFLVPDVLAGVTAVIRPDHGDVANAVGAAIALVGGRAEQIADVADRQRAADEASRAAVAKAVQAGADPQHVEVVEVVETPLSYSARPTVRVAVKAVGPLRRERETSGVARWPPNTGPPTRGPGS